MHAFLTQARSEFHQKLCDHVIRIDDEGVPNFADRAQTSSRQISISLVQQLGCNNKKGKITGQEAGKEFEAVCQAFIQAVFPHFSELRPGSWVIERFGGRGVSVLSSFQQYTHLSSLADLARRNPDLAAALGNEYAITPDIVVARLPESDENINRKVLLVDNQAGIGSGIRMTSDPNPVLHASISCKWTIRSDRAQNARSEALNLIRNRKGRSPHIAVITAEPTPSRISSLALGTGDIDFVYHIALPELCKAVNETGNDEAVSLLNIMLEGKRLKDISDLPLDLCI